MQYKGKLNGKIIGSLAPVQFLSTDERKATITSDQFETTKQTHYNSLPYLPSEILHANI